MKSIQKLRRLKSRSPRNKSRRVIKSKSRKPKSRSPRNKSRRIIKSKKKHKSRRPIKSKKQNQKKLKSRSKYDGVGEKRRSDEISNVERDEEDISNSKKSRKINEIGLHIKSKEDTITNISGPAYMSILKPKDTIIDKFRKLENPIYTPILILFGDYHFSSEYECDCDENDKCLEDVYQFAIKLNNLSSEEYPIDFYLEWFKNVEHGETEEFSKMPLNSLIIKALKCGGNPIGFKDWSFEQIMECPAVNNIRWHFADTRKNEGENKIIEYFMSRFEKYLNKIYEITDLHSAEFKKITIEFIELFRKPRTMDIHDELIGYLKILKTILSNDFLNNLKPDSLMIKEFLKLQGNLNCSKFENIIVEDISNTITRLNVIGYEALNIFIQKFIDLVIIYFSFLKNEPSITIKRNELISRGFPIELMDKNLKDKTKENFDNIYNLIREGSMHIKNRLEIFIKVLVDINVCIMDYYFISRSFKKPFNKTTNTYDNNSILNVSYFGIYHSKHIIDLLVNKLKWYDIELCTENSMTAKEDIPYSDCIKPFRDGPVNTDKIRDNEQLRCISINKDIPLGDMLTELKTKMTKADSK